MADVEQPASGDPLKYYCIVFGLLIVVIGIVYVQIRKQLDAYRTESLAAERMLTADKNAADSQNRPRQLAELGIATQRLVAGYHAAVGTDGDSSGNTISASRVTALASEAGLTLKNADREHTAANRNKGYEQVERTFHFDETNVANFVTMLYNIEAVTRYRVFDVAWSMKPWKENSAPPHHAIISPSVKLGFRRPIASGANN